MIKLSAAKLAETVKSRRKQKELTQEELSSLTGIECTLISRIEIEDYIPSIMQFEALFYVLDFELNDILMGKMRRDPLAALSSEELNKSEREGIEKIIAMMHTVTHQIIVRRQGQNE
ncbi:helix-turn-helix transcriptional regulator [Virgibacillus halodenitrificans]|uniref:helix-turn-helix transcriptional regulator n=1 Tax=Virgibacillus halodenitrificans TaxID=1482 RepID=UPI002DBC44A8|nr:helix-turn-helix transcriptional regulator [Virgibacillus halodenitrificans]MEC2159380.1 helix-turn-helix transcriptional regulator [Virgibacillus halodenitrificans]